MSSSLIPLCPFEQVATCLQDELLLESTSLGGQNLLEESLPARELTVAQTPPSLLNRLRQHPGDGEAWQRFDALYRPLLLTWVRRYSIQPQDADDLVQQVLEVVLQEMPHFHYDAQKGSFRGWLRGILVNRLRDFWRSQKSRPLATGDSDFYDKVLNQLEDPRSDLTRLWDQEHDQHVAQQLLALVEPDFTPTTWQAFLRIMRGEKTADVATDLKISVNAAYLAKSAVLKRLRREMEGLAE